MYFLYVTKMSSVISFSVKVFLIQCLILYVWKYIHFLSLNHQSVYSWPGFANEDLRALTTSGAGSLVADEADS